MEFSFKECARAKKRIAPYLQPTPLVKSESLQKFLGYKGTIYLKLDCEQPTGSFKVRGALNALLSLDPSVKKVVAFSSGNFAQAVAYGASKLKKKATIIMPQNAPHKKIDGTRNLGAEIIFAGEKYEEGEILVKELVDKEGFIPLHPFNRYETMAGQGTIAIEILETNSQMKHFFCPVGGGGLLSGCAVVIKESHPSTIIYAVEPLGADDFYHSFQAKKHLAFEKIETIADGLRATSVGTLNYPILMATVDVALAVPEEKIIEAMRLLWEHHHLTIEPSGAVGLAGFLTVYENIEGETVILITGKNVDEDAFKKWLGMD